MRSNDPAVLRQDLLQFAEADHQAPLIHHICQAEAELDPSKVVFDGLDGFVTSDGDQFTLQEAVRGDFPGGIQVDLPSSTEESKFDEVGSDQAPDGYQAHGCPPFLWPFFSLLI